MKRVLSLLLCILLLNVGVYAADEPSEGDTKELTPLLPPTTVGWGRDYRFLLDIFRRQQSKRMMVDDTEVEYADCPGMMYWTLNDERQNRYRLDIYQRSEEDGNILIDSAEEWSTTESEGYSSSFRFMRAPRVSGSYYFTVREVGDGITYEDSETVQSDIFRYEAPNEQLTRPDRPRWKLTAESSTAYVTPPDYSDSGLGTLDSLYLIGYEARWWYVASLGGSTDDTDDGSTDDSGSTDDGSTDDSGNTDNGSTDDSGSTDDGSTDDSGSTDNGSTDDSGNTDNGSTDDSGSTDNGSTDDSGSSDSSGTGKTSTTSKSTTPKEIGTVLTFQPVHLEFQPSMKMLGEYGSGYYSVQVRALSSDITKMRPSEWSELSMVRYIPASDTDLATIVSRVDEKTDAYNRQIAIDNVRNFGTEKLYELMAADMNNVGAAGDIAKLEAMLGSTANVVVSGGMETVFPASSVSVIGAGLNVDLRQSVTFHLGPAHSDEVLSTLFSHAVRFSMQLLDENGASLTEGGKSLTVPVKITLRVPDTINPSFFVLLHHRTDGTVEKIPLLSLRKVKDQWYASFIVTTFSDFTMAEQGAFLDMKRTSGGVDVSYRVRDDSRLKTLLCAVRERSGRLCAVTTLEPSAVQRTVHIACTDPASACLFLLDAQNRPFTGNVSASLTNP